MHLEDQRFQILFKLHMFQVLHIPKNAYSCVTSKTIFIIWFLEIMHS